MTDERRAAGEPVRVGLVADEGLPADIAQRLARILPALLAEQVPGRGDWEVEVWRESIPLVGTGELPIFDRAERLMPEHGWDMIVCLTELPRWVGDKPLAFEMFHDRRVALISMPAMGWLFVRRRTRRTIVQLVKPMLNRSASTGKASKSENGTRSGERIESHLLAPGSRGRLRLLLGMVRHNRPWRLVPSLDRAIAAAVATAAFPIFYSSIWGMAEVLSPLRLALVNAFAVLAMVGWLIFHNGLWDGRDDGDLRGRVGLYNASTFVTVLIGVACMYAVLFTIALLAALAVIPLEYMEATLKHPAGLGEYAKLAWLASSMGTFAGALGSSFETENAIRQATYSKREHERWLRDQAHADDG